MITVPIHIWTGMLIGAWLYVIFSGGRMLSETGYVTFVVLIAHGLAFAASKWL